MRIVAFRAALVVGVLLPSSASAQLLTLTESEVLARLSADNPRMRAIRSAVDLTRAGVVAAGRWPNPRVALDRESVAGVVENIFTVSQALPLSGRRALDGRAATAMVAASSSRADDEALRLRADARKAFGDLRAAQIREQQLTAAHGRLRELADVLAKREAAGDAAGYDRLLAEREVLELEADGALAVAARGTAQAALAGFLRDTPDPSRLVAADASSPSPPLPPVEALVAQAESARGDLRALREEIDSARLSERAADHRKIPEPEVVVGTKSSNAGRGDIGSVVMVQAALPLFDRGRPERALATARAAQAGARLEVLTLAVRGQVAALHREVAARRAVAERYRADAVRTADQIARIAQVSYDAGERGILELFDAYRSALDVRLRQTSLDASTRQAEIELDFVTALEMPR